MRLYVKYLAFVGALTLTGGLTTGQTVVPQSGVVVEYWENVKGGKVTDLADVSSKRAANAVFIKETIDEAPSGKDNFGLRFSALLVAPESGTYTFYLAADDTAELQISSDDKAANLKKVCEVTRYKQRHQFGPHHGCGKMTLQKGKKYYLELRYKEGGGGDHVGLAWEGPGVKKQILGGRYLVPRLEGEVKKGYERTQAEEKRSQELLAELVKRDPATVPAWLDSLRPWGRNLLDAALQKVQNSLAADNPAQCQSILKPYVDAASGIIASPEKPVKNHVAKRLLHMEEAWLKSLDNKQLLKLGAHRLSSSFGEIPESSATVKLTQKLNSRGDKWMNEMLSLGLYAPPGKAVTVTIPKEYVDKHLEVKVGHHFGERNYALVSMPGSTRFFKLTQENTTFVTPHGGLMLLNVPRNLELKDVEVTIEGALKAPRFVLGKHSNKAWKKLRNAPGPWGELVCDHLIFVVSRELLQKIDNPTELMTWWNENNRDLEDFYAYYPGVPFRMHSGYYAITGVSVWPLHWDVKGVERPLNLEIMKEHNAALFLHEHGHHCDFGEMELSFWAEATPNWGGYYMKARKGKEFNWKDSHDRHLSRLFDPNDKGILEIMQDKWYKISGKGTHHWSHSITSMMIGYTDTFGWNAMKTTIHRLRDKKDDMYKWPFVQGVDADQAKIDRYLIGLSEAAKRDVRPYFAHFKLMPSAGAAAYLDEKNLPKWDLTYWMLPENTQIQKNQSLTLPCGEDSLRSFAKNPGIKWNDTSAKGGTVVCKKGKAVYTPKPGFKGTDTLKYTLTNEYGKSVQKSLKVSVK